MTYVNSPCLLLPCFFPINVDNNNTTYPVRLFGGLNDIISVTFSVQRFTHKNQPCCLLLLFSHQLTVANKAETLILPNGNLILHLCPPAHAFLLLQRPCFFLYFSLFSFLRTFDFQCLLYAVFKLHKSQFFISEQLFG